ncbi:hypothetical protein [Ureaplasma urealyticum]|uniref:hypothetical protein n=1 Tax=Ureaplasma urealyticum TaxID=2130 RepID=UPI00290D6705|nr:hypothetical protein [Ureaplasma urealyticum]
MVSDSKKILESWLMFERLVDGSISNKDKKLLKFDQKEINDEFNFYQFFQEKLKTIKDKNKGIIFYCGIFDFDKLLNKLQKPYVLDPLDENEEVDDKKFSFALCFDGDLKCCYEQSFFSLSGYLYYQNENDLDFDIDNKFQEFEANQKNILKDLFEDLSDNDLINNTDIEMKFNDAIKTYLQKNTNGKISINSLECCAYKIVNNFKNECNYLHSFFVKDLKKALKIDINECKNLKAYLDSE